MVFVQSSDQSVNSSSRSSVKSIRQSISSFSMGVKMSQVSFVGILECIQKHIAGHSFTHNSKSGCMCTNHKFCF